VQRFCKPKVGSSILSTGTIVHAVLLLQTPFLAGISALASKLPV
jgi:hypothetical protein